MVPIVSLLVPVLVSAVLVFLASFVLHMILPLHKGDVRPVPSEDRFLETMRKVNLSPGDYAVPCATSPASMKDPAFIKKMKDGPVVLLTVARSASPAMAKELTQWFAYSIVVGIFAAYIAGRALGPGADYLQVFRFAGCTAFIGYSLALAQHSIWYKRSWVTTLKSMFDGLVYGLLTGGTFGWLWPR